MKVVFVSNYYNHHQSAFSEAIYSKTGGQYLFIETEEIEDERKALGWVVKDYPSFVLRYGIDDQTNSRVEQYIDDAEVAIIGSASHRLIANRVRQGKLTFMYSERIYKAGVSPIKWCYHLYMRILNNRMFKHTYILCASAYTAADYAKLFAYQGKTYKWGYFPEVKPYNNLDDLMDLKRPASILWVARLIDWKHPEVPLDIAKRLKTAGYSFTIDLIGNGVLENHIKTMIREYNLNDCVHLLGSMKPEEVRMHMEQSEIFLFTSDFNEGWGAVLNESMNSGCAVVASHAIGSVPYLLKDGENGLIYENGNTESCYQKVKYLMDHPIERKKIGKKAYFTLHDTWNAEFAAEKLLKLSQTILNGEKNPDLFEYGPCSKAERTKDDWFNE